MRHNDWAGPDAILSKVAPLVAGFDEWALRTSTPWSVVSDSAQRSVGEHGPVLVNGVQKVEIRVRRIAWRNCESFVVFMVSLMRKKSFNLLVRSRGALP